MTATVLPREESLGFWLYRLHVQRMTALRREFQSAGYDVTTEQWALLTRLKEQEGIHQNRLAEKTLKDRHNTTRILNLLEKQNYIERRRDETDKRAYRLFLTKAGRLVQENLTPIVIQHVETMKRGLSEEDIQTLRRMIKHVIGNLEDRLSEMQQEEQGKNCRFARQLNVK